MQNVLAIFQDRKPIQIGKFQQITNIMKCLFCRQIILIALISSCQSRPTIKATLIAIKPYSLRSDKPIDSLFISFDKRFLPDSADWRELIVIDKKKFEAVENYIFENKSKNRKFDAAGAEDGIFEMDISNGNVIVTSYLFKSHQISKEYLTKLINALDVYNMNDKLVDDLRVLLARINY